MLAVIAASSTQAEEVVEILCQWSRLDLIEPFLWCDAPDSSDQTRYRYVQSGAVVENSPEYILANYSESITGIWLTLSPTTDELSDAAGHAVASSVRDRLSTMATEHQRRLDTRLLVVDAVGARLDLVADAYWPYVVYWAPEDRSAPNLVSGMTHELVGPHVADAIAALGNLWKRSTNRSSDAVIAELFGDLRPEEGAVVLGRSFTRILEIPVLVRELLDVVGNDDSVPRPEGNRFDRIDITPLLPAIATRFIESREALRRTEPIVLAMPSKPKVSLLDRLRESWHFLVEEISRRPAEAFEHVLQTSYDWMATWVEKNLPGESSVVRWRETVDSPTSIIADSHGSQPLRTRRMISEGPVNDLWTSLWKTSFALMDGSTLDWGEAWAPHVEGTTPIASSRTQVVKDQRVPVSGPDTSSTVADTNVTPEVSSATSEPSSELASENSAAAAVATDASHAGAVAAKEGPVDYLSEIRSQIEAIQAQWQKALEASIRMSPDAVHDATDGNDVNEVASTPMTKKHHWWQFWKRPAKYQDPNTIRDESRHRLRRILFGGSGIAAVAGGVLSFVFSPIAGIASLIGLLFVTLLSLIREAMAGLRAELRAVDEDLRQKIGESNRIEALECLRADVGRINRRLDEFEDWERIISLSVYQPWRTGAITSGENDDGDWPRPYSVLRGIGSMSDDNRLASTNAFSHSLFKQGWLTSRFGEIRAKITDQIKLIVDPDGEIASLEPESDVSTDEESVRKLFLRHVESELLEPGVDESLICRIREFLTTRTLEQLVTTIGVHYPQLGAGANGPEAELPSVGSREYAPNDYFVDLFAANGSFLESHWKESTSLKTEEGVNKRITIGTAEATEIQVPLGPGDEDIPIRISATLLEFSVATKFDSLRSGG